MPFFLHNFENFFNFFKNYFMGCLWATAHGLPYGNIFTQNFVLLLLWLLFRGLCPHPQGTMSLDPFLDFPSGNDTVPSPDQER
jgi:hypothetical protein